MLARSDRLRVGASLGVSEQRQAEDRPLEAEIAKLSPNEQVVARAQIRLADESITREKATLEAIQEIVSGSKASAGAEAERTAASVNREQKMAETTDGLLTLIKWLVALAF